MTDYKLRYKIKTDRGYMMTIELLVPASSFPDAMDKGFETIVYYPKYELISIERLS